MISLRITEQVLVDGHPQHRGKMLNTETAHRQ